jgi:hypothetical protein
MAGLPDRATPPQAEQAKRLAALRGRVLGIDLREYLVGTNMGVVSVTRQQRPDDSLGLDLYLPMLGNVRSQWKILLTDQGVEIIAGVVTLEAFFSLFGSHCARCFAAHYSPAGQLTKILSSGRSFNFRTKSPPEGHFLLRGNLPPQIDPLATLEALLDRLPAWNHKVPPPLIPSSPQA